MRFMRNSESTQWSMYLHYFFRKKFQKNRLFSGHKVEWIFNILLFLIDPGAAISAHSYIYFPVVLYPTKSRYISDPTAAKWYIPARTEWWFRLQISLQKVRFLLVFLKRWSKIYATNLRVTLKYNQTRLSASVTRISLQIEFIINTLNAMSVSEDWCWTFRLNSVDS